MSFGLIDQYRKLTESAVAMSEGRFEQLVEVLSKDKIGQLTKSFNYMAKTIPEVAMMK
jgi:nitrogen fixation/metabolism regulation signal transduction histidine kinase